MAGNAVVVMQPAGEIYSLYQHWDRRDGVTPLPIITPAQSIRCKLQGH